MLMLGAVHMVASLASNFDFTPELFEEKNLLLTKKKKKKKEVFMNLKILFVCIFWYESKFSI